MPKLEINRSTVNSVMRIEICLPRVFPWKLRGGDRPRHGGYHKVHHHMGGETNETFRSTDHYHSKFLCYSPERNDRKLWMTID